MLGKAAEVVVTPTNERDFPVPSVLRWIAANGS